MYRITLFHHLDGKVVLPKKFFLNLPGNRGSPEELPSLLAKACFYRHAASSLLAGYAFDLGNFLAENSLHLASQGFLSKGAHAASSSQAHRNDSGSLVERDKFDIPAMALKGGPDTFFDNILDFLLHHL